MGNQQSKKKINDTENIILNNRDLTKLPFTPSKESKIKNLYLSCNRLTSLPKDLKEVTLVDLSSNSLGPSLPVLISEALTSYQKLKQLYINQNMLEDFNSFENSNIKTISMAQNRFTQLPDQFFSKFPSLQTLTFDCNFLKALSNQKSEAMNTLSLSLNSIEIIDAPTLSFPQLVSLDLSKNRLTKIPNTFSKSFPNLQTLYLNDNLISEIPENSDDDDLVFPHTLTLLNLSNNLIEKVPNSITCIQKLTHLNVTNNRITHIPQLNSALVEFRAPGNKISSIDNQQLDFLKDIVIYDNELKKFPTEIKCSQNSSLIVDHNEISEISFDQVPIDKILSAQITVINVSFNKIESLPKELFESLPNLHSFSAFFNKITAIPSEISNCQNLYYLNVSYNPLKKLPKIPSSLVRLTASNCQIEEFDQPDATNIRHLDLSQNRLSSFECPPSLQTLNLSQNRIAKMPALTENLRMIDVSMNLIEEAPDALNGVSLIDLNLSDNRLEKLPQLAIAPLLQYLEVSDNKIDSGRLDVSKYPFLKRVDISGTQIEIVGANENLNEVISSSKSMKEELRGKMVCVISEAGKSGYSEYLGLRNSMEDSIIVRDDLNLYAVCDGHGGPNAARLASILLSQLFEDNIEKFSFEKAADFVSENFIRMQQEIEKMQLEDGSTLCLAFVCEDEAKKQRKVVTAHLGDARAMIARKGGVARELTKDHKASMRSEFERVHDMFGCVSKDNRIDGILAVARSIGDCFVFGVGKEPEINAFYLDEDDLFLVVCCDGVFDVLSNDDVARLAVSARSVKEAAYDIRNAAFAALSGDNISAIVVDLKA